MKNLSKYQEAALVWLEQYPGRTLTDCRVKVSVLLENGKPVHLGKYLARIRAIYRAMQKGERYHNCSNLTEEEIKWWTELGMDWDIQRVGRKKKECSFLDFYSNSSLENLKTVEEKKFKFLNHWQGAALVWLEQNPDKTLADCQVKESVLLENGEPVYLGKYLSRIRCIYRAMQKGERYHSCCNLTEEEIEWWTKLGMDWNIRQGVRTKKGQPLLDSQGNLLLKNSKSEDQTLEKKPEILNQWQEAALVWLAQNPGKTLADCPQKADVVLENGEPVHLGIYLHRVKRIYRAMQEGKKYQNYRVLTNEEITWWTNHGMEWKTHIRNTRSLYQQVALYWLEQNPGKTLADCRQIEDVVLKNQKPVPLGRYLSIIRAIYRAMQKGERYQNYCDLTEEEIAQWTELGIDWDKRNVGRKKKEQSLSDSKQTSSLEHSKIENQISEEKKSNILNQRQQAALVWLAQNPGKTLADCRGKIQVTLDSGEVVCLSNHLNTLRSIYRAKKKDKKYQRCSDITEEEIAWWNERGFKWNIRQTLHPSLYRQAALVWLEQHPGKTLADCRQKEDVVLENQKPVHLGHYLSRIRVIYRAMQKGERYQSCCDLTEEEIVWWTELGMNWDKQKAGRKRKEQSPSDSEPTLSLKESNIEGQMLEEKKKEVLTQWQEAALHWLHKNPDKTLSDCVFEENVTLSPKKSVPLGRYLIRIQKIYRAMQQGKRYSNYPDLTEEEIEWWTKHGMNFESSVEKSKDSTASQKTETPKKTANSHKINVKQYTQTAEYTGFHLNKQSIHKIIKKDLQKIVPDQWFVELYEEIMRAAAYRKIYGADILKLADTITRSYLLTPAEQKALYQALRKYLLFAKESYITKVSREPEESLKIDKIQKYGLDEFDIEESFFLELRREQNPILRKKNELLISYIIDWNEYSQEEREEVQKLQGFSDTDMQYIEEMRNRIDTLLEKVKMKRRK